MVYERLANWMFEKRISIPQLASKIGVTKRGLYAMIERKTLTVSTLEKIAEVLEIDTMLFFEKDGLSSEFYSLQQENERLKDEILKLCLENSDLKVIKELAIKMFEIKLSESNLG